MMTFEELLKKRRSIRKYEDKDVPPEIINELIHESTMAPSAGNEQPWKFIIVKNRELIRKISDESKKNILARINENPDDYANRYRAMLEKESLNVFWDAPCVVFILGESSRRNLHVNCSLAAAYFMMGAASRGLGTCWVNLGAEIHDPDMLSELGIPSDHTIVAPIALGYPANIPSTPKRNEPEILKIIH